MDAVFAYFWAVGAGISAGIATVTLPILWLLSRMSKQKKKNVSFGK